MLEIGACLIKVSEVAIGGARCAIHKLVPPPPAFKGPSAVGGAHHSLINLFILMTSYISGRLMGQTPPSHETSSEKCVFKFLYWILTISNNIDFHTPPGHGFIEGGVEGTHHRSSAEGPPKTLVALLFKVYAT